MERWASFDCYGTLIDWNGGIRRVLADVFGDERADEQLARYHEVETMLEVDGSRTYREVMTEAMRELGADREDAPLLAESLPFWEPFPEVRAALTDARARGWKLAILSNTDRDLIEASMREIGVPFELAIVASEIGSYKPRETHWLTFFDRSGASREGYVHVAQSHVHDIVPATSLGLRTIWINRLGLTGEPEPTRMLADLARLPDTLDELVPA
jgi:2-haloacid dehalogenase